MEDALLVFDEQFKQHQAPSWHPEAPDRLDAIRRGMDSAIKRGVEVESLELVSATEETLYQAHTKRHIDNVKRAVAQGHHLDPDTYTSSESDVTARFAVGSTIAACEAVLDDRSPNFAFAAVRPPGHHAESDRAMGFCLYSNVAIAALDLRARGLAKRIAIVDWDVHHGNGTQQILYDLPDLLYLSLHHYPFYPGTGGIGEIGQGHGEGWTVNLPLPAGSGDGDYVYLLESVVLPVLELSQPDLIIVSAGYDAHQQDPLGGMQLTSPAYGEMTKRLMSLGRPIVAVLEGGYSPEGLMEGTEATLLAFAGETEFLESPMEASPTATSVAGRVLEKLGPFWPELGP